ncbi:MAG: hypothetical protein ACI9WU_001807 [Myxococcota bacterium]|jgi:hypothetical protein
MKSFGMGGALCLVLVLAASGCSSDDDSSTDAGTGSTATGDTTGATSDGDSTGDTDGTATAGDTTGGETTGDATGADTSGTDEGAVNACTTSDDCSNGDTCIEGVCLFTPVEAVVLTDNRDDNEVEAPPNLDCVGGAITAPADGPETATIYGIVDRFGGGRQTINMQVSVFLASEWPPAECTGRPFDEQRDCFREVEAPNGWSTISTDPEIEGQEVPATCSKHQDCPSGYECVDLDFFVCSAQFGLYEIAGIPTNTALVIRARNDESASIFDSKWKDTYTHGIYVFSDRVDDDGRYKTNALMVSDSQWKTIPNTLFVSGGIKKGNGALGGRIRDCRGGDDRPSFTVGWASVNALTPGSALGYFNDNEADTVPLVDRKGTDIFGRFTIVDVPPGANRVAAAINLDGTVTSLGAEDAYVVPDSLSVVAFPGKLPILNK